MKIGILADIHGNQYALEEVLLSARKEKIEKLLVLGDIVGYYYHPEKVLEKLNDWDFDFIKGNHENILIKLISKEITASAIRSKYGSGHQKAIEQLSNHQIEFLIHAPENQKLEIQGSSILICHVTPWQSDFYLYPDSPKEILDKCDIPDIDFVFTGHSHHAFVHFGKESLLVGVGSVGQNRSIGGVASWAILNTANGTIQLKSTPYDVSPLLYEIQRHDPDIEYLKDILVRNRI